MIMCSRSIKEKKGCDTIYRHIVHSRILNLSSMREIVGFFFRAFYLFLLTQSVFGALLSAESAKQLMRAPRSAV